jgi:hypothetical protein
VDFLHAYGRAPLFSSYDVDYPAECDDEYWDPPDMSKAFQQPPEKPSVMAYWTFIVKLIQIIDMIQMSVVRNILR